MSGKSLFQQVMGAEFFVLPAPVRRFHALGGTHVLHGWVEVRAPASWAGRVLAWCLGAPQKAVQGPIRFQLEAQPAGERWVRHFPGKTMASRLRLDSGRVVEQLGAARLTFALCGHADKLRMHLVALHLLGARCPRWLMPDVVAEETTHGGRLHFRVQASVRWAGVVTGYQGYLELPRGGPP